jgi:hypothetical protein
MVESMKNMGSKKIVLTVLTIFVVIMAFFFYSFWNNRLKPYLLFQETRENMRMIGNDIALFNGKYDKLPTSLEEMVKAGFLPEKSELYYCPVRHSSLSSKELSYNEYEFVIIFEPNIVVIRIPQEVFDNTFYKRASEGARKWEITSSCKAYAADD